MDLSRWTINESYRTAVLFGLGEFTVAAVLGVLLLDGGAFARQVALGAIAYLCIATPVILFYRPTRFAIAVVQFGFLVVFCSILIANTLCPGFYAWFSPKH